MPVKNREQLAKDLYDVTLVTLETMPERTLKFLRAVGTNRSIFARLGRRGYSASVHAEGWQLLRDAASVNVSGEPISDFDATVADAIAQVDEMDGVWIRVIAASWKRLFPEQSSYVLADVEPATGTEAVLNMAQILQRLMALESGADRAATRQQDTAALALLAERGIDPSKRTEAAALVEEAMSTPSGSPRTAAELAAADEAYVRALGGLRDWYELWSEMARVEVRRRDRLIQLGLAHRQYADDDEPQGPVEDGPGTPGSGLTEQ